METIPAPCCGASSIGQKRSARVRVKKPAAEVGQTIHRAYGHQGGEDHNHAQLNDVDLIWRQLIGL